MKNAFAAALREAGIENYTFHDCRHTATTRITASGMPAAEAMKITGHTQMVTFQRFVNIADDAARNGAERLDALIDTRAARAGASETRELEH